MAPPEHTSGKQAYYSIYRPQKDERLSWPSWLTCTGRFIVCVWQINCDPLVTQYLSALRDKVL